MRNRRTYTSYTHDTIQEAKAFYKGEAEKQTRADMRLHALEFLKHFDVYPDKAPVENFNDKQNMARVEGKIERYLFLKTKGLL
jgi:hypothetical protein